MYECPTCGGFGAIGDQKCNECDDGSWRLTECPNRYVSGRVVTAYRHYRFARRGAWPVAGGTTDQTRWFFDYCELLAQELAPFYAKLGILDG